MEGLKILIIGDPHIKSDNTEQTNLMSVNICDIINKEKPNIIVVLGDILHKHDKIDLYPYHRAEKFLRNLHTCKPFGSHLYILIGNHDRPNNSIYLTDEHAFNSLKAWPETYVIDNVQEINYNGFNVLCVPYVPTGKFENATIDINFDNIHIVFAHQEFKGAKMNSITSNEGDIYQLHYPLCISGHIHDYDKLQENLIYTGTPIQHGFTDTTDKTISLLQYDENFKLLNHERITLDIPKKLQFILTAKELINFDPPLNAHIKIKLKGTIEEIKEVMKMDYVKNLLLKGIKIIPVETNDQLVVANTIFKEVKTKISFQERLNNAILLEKEEIQIIFKKMII